jgi:glycosyltransferase involved in cell wall biosynthesis
MDRLRVRRRSDAVLAVVDAGVALLVAWLAFVLRFEGDRVPPHYISRYRIAALVVLAVWIVSARAAGLYRRAALRRGESVIEPAVEAALVVGVTLLIVNAVALSDDLSRAWIALVSFGLILGGVASRELVRRSRRMLVPLGIGLERYALVGSDETAQRLLGDLTRAPGAPFEVVEVLPAGLSSDELAVRAEMLRVDGLIFPTGGEPRDLGRLAARLSGAGIDVLLAPRMGDLDMRVASIAMLHGVPLLRAAGLSPRRRGVRAPAHHDLHRGVAILGTRGVPANYGGFETFAERLALHLVENGVPVTVYCRKHHATAGSSWRGVQLVTLPTIKSKYLDTVVHTLLSTLHLVTRSRIRDVILCNAANAPALPVLRLFRRRVVMNVDGLEWRRGKWGIVGRSWYRMGEWLSVRFASVLVTDAAEVQTYYRVRHDSDSVMIPYGADLLERDLALPPELAVTPDHYFLYVSRWERENNPVLVAEAHATAATGVPLVMLGTATYDAAIGEAVRAVAAPDAVLPGAVFGAGYVGLQSGARAYIHATEVGGTHPALIEAMGAGNLCLVLDTPENREVVGSAGRYFADRSGLVELLRATASMGPGEVAEWRRRARDRAREQFSWSAVGDAYLGLLGAETGPRGAAGDTLTLDVPAAGTER